MFVLSKRNSMKNLFLLIAVSLGTAAAAQTKISGKVVDQRNRPLQGASVAIKNAYDGAVSDSTGKFRFKTTEKDTQYVVATMMGYKDAEALVICKGADQTVTLQLKEKLDELKAVTVTAGSFEAGDKKRAATVLSSLDVYTTGGANADITAAIKTLPGAQQVGEQEGLFVRGGAGFETKQFIDGTVVNNPFNASVPNIASRGRFQPNLFKGTVFSTGGYSALYGQALSSAVILESIDIPEKSEISASITSVFLGAGLQKITKKKNASYGFNVGYTNLTPTFSLVKQTPDFFTIPVLQNGDANFRIKTKRGIVKFYTQYATNSIGLRRPNIDSAGLKDAFGISNYNWYNNLSWRENFGSGWKLNLGISYSTNKDIIASNIQNGSNQNVTGTGKPWLDNRNFDLTNQSDLSQIKLVFDKRLSGISVLRFGAENWYGYNTTTINGTKFTLKDNLTAAFAESDIYVTNNLAAKIGVRGEYSTAIAQGNIAPRLSMAYKVGKQSTMSVIYGQFFQSPEVNNLMRSAANLGYMKADHYMMNFIHQTTLQTLRVEAFHKQYHSLITTSPINGSFANGGDGYAKGIEFFWRDKKTISGLDYWVTYSYLNTERTFNNYPSRLAPTFAAEHTASLVVKKFISKINTGFNFTYSFATGRPYYNFVNTGSQFAIADQGVTKNFHNLGFSANYLTKIGKAFAVVVASVTNVTNANPVFGYNYSHDGSNKVAVTLPAPRFYFLGVFLSWGVDRRQDAINNNL